MSDAKKLDRVSIPWEGREFFIETGKYANMADGSVICGLGDTQLLATAGIGNAIDGDFLPLTVDFEERFYAGGKIKGSRFIKRETRPPEDAILTARLIDRPCRPMFPKGLRNEIQVIVTPLSSEKEFHPGPMAITAASAAIMLSGVPFAAPVAGVRVGMKDGELILNPNYEQAEEGDLNLVVAGTADAITMVEAGANELPEEKMVEALEFAHDNIKKLCDLQNQLVEKVGRKNLEAEGREIVINAPDETVKQELEHIISDAEIDQLYAPTKHEVYHQLDILTKNTLEKVADKIEGDKDKEEPIWTEGKVMEAVDKIFKEYMRAKVLSEGKRLDGRAPGDIRDLSCTVGVFPRPHGTGLFQRGETQVCTFTTLGGPGDKQLLDSMDLDEEKRYIHHYNFPPYSTGEVKRLRGTSRREIGHGFLAERALEPVLPEEADFPYTMRLVSEVLACNGSSSMASVCGSTLSLMHAGVPIKAPVAGIAMGLVADDPDNINKYQILTDIQGMEDFAGDMDFKTCGTDKGITALQMDIKVKGMPREILTEALVKGREARVAVLKAMTDCIAEPNKTLSPYAPLIESVKIDPELIRDVIGKGGETIQKIQKECEVEIDINDDGIVTITAPDQEAGNKAKEWVQKIVYRPEIGDVFSGPVVRIMDFGAFVQIGGGKDGLVHVSELAPWRVENVTDVVSEGDEVKVKLMEIDDQGRYNLSAKAADPNQFDDKKQSGGGGNHGGGDRPNKPFHPSGGRPRR